MQSTICLFTFLPSIFYQTARYVVSSLFLHHLEFIDVVDMYIGKWCLYFYETNTYFVPSNTYKINQRSFHFSVNMNRSCCGVLKRFNGHHPNNDILSIVICQKIQTTDTSMIITFAFEMEFTTKWLSNVQWERKGKLIIFVFLISIFLHTKYRMSLRIDFFFFFCIFIHGKTKLARHANRSYAVHSNDGKERCDIITLWTRLMRKFWTVEMILCINACVTPTVDLQKNRIIVLW